MDCFKCWKSGGGRIAPGTEELLAEQREDPVSSPPKAQGGPKRQSLPKLQRTTAFEVLSAPKLQRRPGFEADSPPKLHRPVPPQLQRSAPPKLQRSVGFDVGDVPVVFSQPLSQDEVLPGHLVQGTSTEEGAGAAKGTSKPSGSPRKKEAWIVEPKKSKGVKRQSSAAVLSPISEKDTPVAEASSQFLLQPAESDVKRGATGGKGETVESATQLEQSEPRAAFTESKSVGTTVGKSCGSFGKEEIEILPAAASSSSLHVTDLENLDTASISVQSPTGEMEMTKLFGKRGCKLPVASAGSQVMGMVTLPGAVEDVEEEFSTPSGGGSTSAS